MGRIITITFLGFLAPYILFPQNAKRGVYGNDTVVVSASTKYNNASFFRRLLIGTNYRKEWSQEVKMPVFRLRHTEMKIIELGGGQQTKSLKLEDKNGKEWALRTIDKEAEGAMPKALKGTIAQKVVQDVISGAYPYAPLTVAHLAKAAGIVAPDPKLYYIPPDAGLGEYQHVFTGKVCFLEEREPTRKGSKETSSTTDVQQDILEANDRLVLQREVLKARLLDMLIADWDRHEGQWRWGEVDSTKAKYFYAIPRDRDQAFFMAKGLIPKVGKFVAMHHINWFKSNTRGLRNLNYKSWEFDQIFLNDLDAAEWERTIKEFTNRLNEKVIHDAVKKLPPEIYVISGSEIEKILQDRIRNMPQDVMKYYRFLSQIVQVNGSNEDEIFAVSGRDDLITVTVFRQGKAGKQDIKIYERIFKENETSQIRLMGYNGSDKFVIDQPVSSRIKIKILREKEKDNYGIKGGKKGYLHDSKRTTNNDLSTENARLMPN